MTRSSQPLWIQRALIRNDEALVTHLHEQLAGEDGIVDALPTPGNYSDERARLMDSLGHTLRRLKTRRAQLPAPVWGNPSPAAPASPKTLAGSLVTHGAAQPD